MVKCAKIEYLYSDSKVQNQNKQFLERLGSWSCVLSHRTDAKSVFIELYSVTFNLGQVGVVVTLVYKQSMEFPFFYNFVYDFDYQKIAIECTVAVEHEYTQDYWM